SLPNLVRAMVARGVATERVTSDRARPMVRVPRSRPIRRWPGSRRAIRSSMGTMVSVGMGITGDRVLSPTGLGHKLTSGKHRDADGGRIPVERQGAGYEDHMVRAFRIPR